MATTAAAHHSATVNPYTGEVVAEFDPLPAGRPMVGDVSTSEPLWMTQGAWETLRDRVIGPAEAKARRTGAADAAGLTQLLATWRAAQREGHSIGVFVTPEQAIVLAGLLDECPELAQLLDR
jgi:hypothetical protein